MIGDDIASVVQAFAFQLIDPVTGQPAAVLTTGSLEWPIGNIAPDTELRMIHNAPGVKNSRLAWSRTPTGGYSTVSLQGPYPDPPNANDLPAINLYRTNVEVGINLSAGNTVVTPSVIPHINIRNRTTDPSRIDMWCDDFEGVFPGFFTVDGAVITLNGNLFHRAKRAYPNVFNQAVQWAGGNIPITSMGPATILQVPFTGKNGDVVNTSFVARLGGSSTPFGFVRWQCDVTRANGTSGTIALIDNQPNVVSVSGLDLMQAGEFPPYTCDGGTGNYTIYLRAQTIAASGSWYVQGSNQTWLNVKVNQA